MSFERYLKVKHGKTWHQFKQLDAETQEMIHAGWLKNRDQLGWGAWFKTVLVGALGAVTAMVVTVLCGRSGQ